MKQSFVVLVDTSDRILRFMFRKNDFRVFPLREPAQSLRVKMKKYLRRRALDSAPYEGIQKELNLIYRSLLSRENPRVEEIGRIRYLWLPGLHSLAPLYPRPGEKLFQVLDVQKLLEYPSLSEGQRLETHFQLKAVGKRRFPSLLGKEKYLAKRVYAMEKFLFSPVMRKEGEERSLEKKEAFSTIYHIFRNLDETNRDSFAPRLLREEPGLAHSPYFLSSNFLNIFKPEHIRNYNFFLRDLSRSFRAPGVILLQRPSRIGHVYFLQHFYDKASSLEDIGGRFSYAYYLTKQEKSGPKGRLDYRMFTSSFLQN